MPCFLDTGHDYVRLVLCRALLVVHVSPSECRQWVPPRSRPHPHPTPGTVPHPKPEGPAPKPTNDRFSKGGGGIFGSIGTGRWAAGLLCALPACCRVMRVCASVWTQAWQARHAACLGACAWFVRVDARRQAHPPRSSLALPRNSAAPYHGDDGVRCAFDAFSAVRDRAGDGGLQAVVPDGQVRLCLIGGAALGLSWGLVPTSFVCVCVRFCVLCFCCCVAPGLARVQ